MLDVELLIWCFAGGIVVACLYAFYAKAIVGKLIRALVKGGAIGEEKAVALDAVGCGGFIYRFIMRGGTLQNGAVLSTGDEKCYIKPGCEEKLLSKFGRDDASILSLAIVLTMTIVAVLLIAALYPTIADLFVDMWND